MKCSGVSMRRAGRPMALRIAFVDSESRLRIVACGRRSRAGDRRRSQRLAARLCVVAGRPLSCVFDHRQGHDLLAALRARSRRRQERAHRQCELRRLLAGVLARRQIRSISSPIASGRRSYRTSSGTSRRTATRADPRADMRKGLDNPFAPQQRQRVEGRKEGRGSRQDEGRRRQEREAETRQRSRRPHRLRRHRATASCARRSIRTTCNGSASPARRSTTSSPTASTTAATARSSPSSRSGRSMSARSMTCSKAPTTVSLAGDGNTVMIRNDKAYKCDRPFGGQA